MGTRATGSWKTRALAELGQHKEPSLPRRHGWLCHPEAPRPKPSTHGVPKGHPKQGPANVCSLLDPRSLQARPVGEASHTDSKGQEKGMLT